MLKTQPLLGNILRNSAQENKNRHFCNNVVKSDNKPCHHVRAANLCLIEKPGRYKHTCVHTPMEFKKQFNSHKEKVCFKQVSAW